MHRIGRTGRAGRSGIAISFCNYDELAYLMDIERLIGKAVPVVEEHPWPMEISKTQATKTPPPKASGTKPKAPKISERQVTPVLPAAKAELAVSLAGTGKPNPVGTKENTASQPPKTVRRALRSDPWVPGRVVAFADVRRRNRKTPK